jgi:hypothetical protein
VGLQPKDSSTGTGNGEVEFESMNEYRPFEMHQTSFPDNLENTVDINGRTTIDSGGVETPQNDKIT